MRPTIEINDPEILRLGHAAEVAFCLDMAIEHLECEGLVTVSIGLADPILNVVIDTDIAEKDVHEKINAVAKFFKQRNIAWSWIVNSLVKPVTLPNYLRQHNLEPLDEFPSLYFDLNNLDINTPPQPLDIREAPQEDELHEWIKPVRASFNSSDNAEGFRKLAAKVQHGVGTVFHHYMVYKQEQIVAAGTLYTGPESIMIHNLATMPDHRNQGLATALTLHMMREAKKLGYRHCFLDSSESGLNIYRRIGFKIYTTSEIFGYKNPHGKTRGPAESA